MNTPTVYLVDDDEAIRDALSWLLQSRGLGCELFESAEALLNVWKINWIGCFIFDVRMTGLSGLELFNHLREKGFNQPVIFLTGHGDVPMAVQALKSGAFDFIEKPFNDNELVDKVLLALNQAKMQAVKQAGLATIEARLNTLTQREKQIMDLVLAGKLNKVIADELGIAMRTVEVHRAHLFEKMGIRTAVELSGLMRNY
jgi:two-component system, LuxR family, response regulator DctR